MTIGRHQSCRSCKFYVERHCRAERGRWSGHERQPTDGTLCPEWLPAPRAWERPRLRVVK